MSKVFVKNPCPKSKPSPKILDFGLVTKSYQLPPTHHDLIYMGDLHVVLPALNLSTLNAGILKMAHEILVSAQGPFLGFWVWGLGVWGLGLGLTIISILLS